MSLGLGGGVFGTFYYLMDIIRKKIRAKMYCSVSIKHTDETFKWINKFMKDNEIIKGDSQLRCRIQREDLPWWEEIFKPKGGKPNLEFVPGAGQHLFKYKGKRFWVYHHIGETVISGWERMPTEMETLTIITWGTDTSYIKDFVDAAVVHSMKTDHDKVGIYELHQWGIGWTKV